jgi:acetoin utilization deacetylase AcuC-like enzyme
MKRGFALVDDELFDSHECDEPHPERPARLHAARRALDHLPEDFDRVPLPARDASHEEILRVHTTAYMQRIDQAAGLKGHFDADTYYAPLSVRAARRAAGGVVAIAEQLMTKQVPLGLALVRPPGHHATADRAMGFCLLNNVPIAAAHVRSLGLDRVAIIDWDVHHGNGTQDIFYADPHVLYVSLHQWPFYPGTGASSECGTSEGRGYTVNIPLSAGADGPVYLAAFERIVGPVLHEYAPELVLISAGFDAHQRDPLAAMRLSNSDYADLFQAIHHALPRDAGGLAPGIGIVLEGGYDLEALAGSIHSTMNTALVCTSNRRPEEPAQHRPVPTLAELSPVHARDLERAEAAQREFWALG